MLKLLHYFLLLGLFKICDAFDDGVSFGDKTTFAHNYVRDAHLVSNLVWDNNLAETAQAHSRKMASDNSMEHSLGSKRGAFGENLYKGFDGFKRTKTIAEAVYYWYLEIAKYNFDNPDPDFESTGHFTQLVWRSTTLVGCGYSIAELYGGLMTHIVCQYKSSGNLRGLYLQNVLPISDGTSLPNSPDQLEAPIGCIDTNPYCMNWVGVCRQAVFRDIMLRYCKKTCNIC